MQKQMIVFLHNAEPLQASWVVLDENGRITQTVVDTALTAGITDADVIVVIPAQDVLLTQANLPKLNRQRLMQALPFALEEQLIDELDDLHFAIGPYINNQPLPVAVVAKQKMESWIAALKAIDISPTAIIPSIFILPTEENIWHINSHDGSSIVRTGKYTGFACESSNLDTLLELNLFEEKDKELFQRVRTGLPEHMLLEKMSRDALTDPPINLLQGLFHAKRKSTNTKKIWMLAGYLVAAWILVAFLSEITSFFILHRQASNIEIAINNIYKQNFPQATAVVSPRKRMEEKLKATFASANKNNFLALLSLISKSMPEKNSVHLNNLEFRDKQLTIEVSANSFDSLDAFTAALTQQGLSVKRQNAGVSGTEVKANLQINAGAS